MKILSALDLRKLSEGGKNWHSTRILRTKKSLQIQRLEGSLIFVGAAGQISNLLIKDLKELEQLINFNKNY